MPVELVAAPIAGATVIEYFSSASPKKFIDDIYNELRRRQRTPLLVYDVDLLDLEHQYALARVLTGCPKNRTVYLHTVHEPSLCAVLQALTSKPPAAVIDALMR